MCTVPNPPFFPAFTRYAVVLASVGDEQLSADLAGTVSAS